MDLERRKRELRLLIKDITIQRRRLLDEQRGYRIELDELKEKSKQSKIIPLPKGRGF